MLLPGGKGGYVRSRVSVLSSAPLCTTSQPPEGRAEREEQISGIWGVDETGSHFPALQWRTRWGSSASQSLGAFQEGASLAALSVHFQFHLEKRHGELPPPWRHTDPRDLFLPVQSEHVSAVSRGAGLPVLAAWHSSPRARPCWKRRQK